jgi:hypothetical protein
MGYASHPIYPCDTGTSRPVAVQRRPGKATCGTALRGHLRRLLGRIRRWSMIPAD